MTNESTSTKDSPQMKDTSNDPSDGYVPSNAELRRDALAAANLAIAGRDSEKVLPLAREFYAFLKGDNKP